MIYPRTTHKGDTVNTVFSAGITRDSRSTSGTTNHQQNTSLPQTGNENRSGLIGLGLAGLFSAFGLGKMKRKDD